MNNVYFISQNQLTLSYNNKLFDLNKYKYLKISDVQKNDSIQIFSRNNMYRDTTQLDISNAQTNLFNRVYNYNDKLFIEILSDNFPKNLKQKSKTNSCEIYLYDNTAMIIYDETPYLYYFNYQQKSYCYEIDKKLYVFNDNVLLVFNFLNLTFDFFNIKKLEKNSEKIEIFVDFIDNSSFFLLFTLYIKNNSCELKYFTNNNYRDNLIKINPYECFYFCKYNLPDFAEKYKSSFNTDKLSNYFKNYDKIIEIENSFYLTNFSHIQPINMIYQNGVLVDID